MHGAAAWALPWIEHTAGALLGYIGIFAIIIVVVWLLMLGMVRKEVKKMNADLKRK
jgi:hypothetical protein